MFSIFVQLADTLIFMTVSIISSFGWKVAWQINGLFGICVGALIVLTIREPPRGDQLVHDLKSKNEQEKQEAISEAHVHASIHNLEVDCHSLDEKIILKNKSKSLGDVCTEYGQGFKLLAQNGVAILILIGASLRLWETGIIGFFMMRYFKVYPNEYELFSQMAAVGSFFGGMLANVVSGTIISFFGKRRRAKQEENQDSYQCTKTGNAPDMTIPIICAVKAAVDIPFCLMTYFQQSNFMLSVSGLYMQLVLVKD